MNQQFAEFAESKSSLALHNAGDPCEALLKQHDHDPPSVRKMKSRALLGINRVPL